MKISLFPFLPVLLCMMGAMIMLLVVVAQNVQEQAIAPGTEEQQKASTITIEDIEELRYKIDASTEEADWYADNFVITRKNEEQKLADLQAQLAIAEKKTQEIKEELEQLEQLTRQLDGEPQVTPEEVESLRQQLEQQKQRKAETLQELTRLQKKTAQKKKSYAVVPYRGINGTHRRPIYIECFEDKVVIQPEGIKLLPNDFQALDRPDNPFDTVLRVIRQYHIDTHQTVRGNEAYPLLLVRPSGIGMYENVLRATRTWVKEFGYEVIPADWNMEYPAPDNELRRRALQQLELARNRLTNEMIARKVEERQNRLGSGNSPQFRVDYRGNVVPVGNSIQSGEFIQRQQATNRQEPTNEDHYSVAAYSANQQDHAVRQSLSQQGLSSPNQPQQGQSQPTHTRNISPESRVSPSPPSPFLTDDARVREGVGQSAGVTGARQQGVQRSTNWALKGITQFSTGISRTVMIQCEADKFVISKQSGLQSECVIPIADSVSRATDQIVKQIGVFQESWGSAGENLHWRPILRVRVLPGGEQRLQELKALLKDSGLVIEE